MNRLLLRNVIDISAHKICKDCGEEKSIEDFYARSGPCGSYPWCKECHNKRSNESKLRNPEANKESDRNYRAAHREHRRIYNRAWTKANPEKRRAKKKRLRTNNAGIRISDNLRSRVRAAVKGVCKSDSTMALLGCTIDQLLGHLEINFQNGMTWQNYGKWHVDHKCPCATFDLSDPAQQKQAFHWSNLQPLWAEDNIRKGARCQ